MFRIINSKAKVKILAVLFTVAFVVWIFVFTEAKENDILEVDFFDVGQGDSIFIETPNNKQVLIDGGPSSIILEKLGKGMAFYDRYIDLIISTHPEYDHLNGLIEVIKCYNVGAIITTGIIRDTAQYKEWIKVIEERGIPVYIAQSGGEFDFGNNIKLNILYPFENLAGRKVSQTNNTSIVSQLLYKDFELLLAGDIEKEAERKLVNSKIDLKSDVLKVPHHGSRTSSTEEFLETVGALVAVIQVGRDNKYGHPHREVLERLAETLTLRTDRDGDIKIISDGKKFLIKK